MEDVSAEDPGWGRGAPPAWGRGAPRGRGRGAPQGRGRGNNPRRAINASSWRTRESEATEPRVIPQLRPMPPSPTVPFKDPQKPPKLWAIYCFDDYFNMQYEEEQLQNFTRTMMTKAREVGLIFEEPLVIKITLLQDIDDVKIFFNDLFLERRHFELLFIGIPESKSNLGQLKW